MNREKKEGGVIVIPLFLVSFRHTVTSPAGRGGKASRGKARTESFLSVCLSFKKHDHYQHHRTGDRETPTFQWLNGRPALLEWRLERNKRTTLI